MDRKFDVIIFGASGYTGKYVIREAINLLSEYNWAIAGRNGKKLQETLQNEGIRINQDLSSIPIIIADINDPNSLTEMTKQAKVVVNCCGPYRFYGEQVVKACIETSTNNVDVSGEPEYMEATQLKYHEAAREKEIYIVSGCGYDSIPSDLGTVYLQRNFGGTVNSINLYTKTRYLNNFEALGAGVNFATYESAVYGLSHVNDLKEIRKKLFKKKIPIFKPVAKELPVLHKAVDVDQKWSLSIPAADQSVMIRSQKYFYENENQRPIQIKTYKIFNSLSDALKAVAAGLLFRKMTNYKCGRQYLLTYPEFFSFGFASRDGPSEERNANTVFELILIGVGWKQVFDDSMRNLDVPPNRKMMCKVTCVNPLYGVASKAVLLSAITILTESSKMPDKGGVYSPGAAFKNTSLIKKLQDNGVTFEVMHTNDIKAKL